MIAQPSAGVADPVALERMLIVIGASTGGAEAIAEVLVALPKDMPGILVAQHMPQAFVAAFAARLDRSCRITVREAVAGERVRPGHAYIAPGHSHLGVRRLGDAYQVALSQDAAVSRHRPSVDVLFASAASQAGADAIGVILTGMGSDGAAGMRELRAAGGWCIAQDETSCVVFGMPKKAIQVGVDEVLPIGAIARALINQRAWRAGQRASGQRQRAGGAAG